MVKLAGSGQKHAGKCNQKWEKSTEASQKWHIKLDKELVDNDINTITMTIVI
jgi:hypothetical protein